jgi:ubiquitin carboxyl-terminal hydrolase 10
MKKNVKEAGGIEVGRYFYPTMFDVVFKTFSPDQPLSPLGRPTQEDAQEFLSFVMDQLHNELLKLEGSDLNGSGGNKISLVTVSGNDDWEIVVPKNRTEIIRTQTFMESELSAIFGGKLRSVSKSRGKYMSFTSYIFV